jgi:hypothetical protein
MMWPSRPYTSADDGRWRRVCPRSRHCDLLGQNGRRLIHRLKDPCSMNDVR